MKQIYICEKCNKQFDNWDDAAACESSHFDSFCTDFDTELQKRMQYKPGGTTPDKIVVAYDSCQWNSESQEYKHTYHFVAYKLIGEVSPTEQEAITAEKAERDAEREAMYERWRQEREAKEKAESESA